MPSPVAQPAQTQEPVTIDAVMELLRSNPNRKYRIDIEVDSTIAGDEAQERQDRAQFIEATTKMVEAWGPIVAGNPLMAQLGGELLKFGIRGFRVGRMLEEVVDETVDKLLAAAGQPKPPPQPSPDEMIKLEGVKMKAQAEIMRAHIDVEQAKFEAQAKAEQTQLDMQMMREKAAHEAASHERETAAKAAELQMTHQFEAARLQMGMDQERERHGQDMAAREREAELQAAQERDKHAFTMDQKRHDAERADKDAERESKKEKASEGEKKKSDSRSDDLIAALVSNLTRGRKVVRGKDGKVESIE